MTQLSGSEARRTAPFLFQGFVERPLCEQSRQEVGVGHQAQLPLQFEHARARLQASQQFAFGDRLGKEVVGAAFQSGDHLGRPGFGGEKDGVNVVRQRGVTNLPAQFQTVDARHFPVGDEEVGTVRVDGVERLLAVGGGADRVARLLQPFGEKAQHGRIVVDQQDFVVAWRHGAANLCV